MNTTSRRRALVAAGLTLGTAAAGLLGAPAASAATADPYPYQGTPSLTVSPGTVQEGGHVTVSGDKCITDDALDDVAVVVYLDGTVGDPDQVPVLVEPDPTQGTWSVDLSFGPGTIGEHQVDASCGHYSRTTRQATSKDYPSARVTVIPAASPAPSSSPATPAEWKAGATANTPGIATRTTPATTTATPAPGTRVVRVYAGFVPGEQVTVVLHSTPVELGTFGADADGVVTVSFLVPADTPAGDHVLALDGDQGSHFEDALTVAAATTTTTGASLAYTGASPTMPLLGGSLLVAAGAGALVLGRRRRAAGDPQA